MSSNHFPFFFLEKETQKCIYFRSKADRKRCCRISLEITQRGDPECSPYPQREYSSTPDSHALKSFPHHLLQEAILVILIRIWWRNLKDELKGTFQDETK